MLENMKMCYDKIKEPSIAPMKISIKIPMNLNQICTSFVFANSQVFHSPIYEWKLL